MNPFERLCPAPPTWSVRWPEIAAACPWLPGPAAERARPVVSALTGLDEFRGRPPEERVRIFTAALFLDAGRGADPPDDLPASAALPVRADAAFPVGVDAGFSVGVDAGFPVRADAGDGNVARRGELVARRVLWEMGVPIAWREHVAALVRHQRLPFEALERTDLDRVAFRVSLLARNDDLALLALARGGADEEVALFRQYTLEIGCWDGPRAFASDHARFEYFRTPGRDPGYAAFDDTRCTVTVMSGLPGSGKDHWIARNRPGVPVVSLDDLREKLGVRPTGDQGPVIAAANARARELLRAGTAYVWNATNVTRALRSRCIGLAAGYGARVEVVSVEAPPDVVHRRNRARARTVPAAVIDRMAGRWELPDPTEAHAVSWVDNA
ncbi:AAA family ATPase [Dactylosporangium sp. CA-233914]|uniref:AAA family ATPase n=1 Tax=Dactylosporangium sp. CA-233914 TaxID=3239934 RepID=UPI003D8D75F9